MVLKNLDIHLHKNGSGPFSYTKHNLKMDEIPKSETVIHPNPRGKFRQQIFVLNFSDCYQGTSQKAQETKKKLTIRTSSRQNLYNNATGDKMKGNPHNRTRFFLNKFSSQQNNESSQEMGRIHEQEKKKDVVYVYFVILHSCQK